MNFVKTHYKEGFANVFQAGVAHVEGRTEH